GADGPGGGPRRAAARARLRERARAALQPRRARLRHAPPDRGAGARGAPRVRGAARAGRAPRRPLPRARDPPGLRRGGAVRRRRRSARDRAPRGRRRQRAGGARRPRPPGRRARRRGGRSAELGPPVLGGLSRLAPTFAGTPRMLTCERSRGYCSMISFRPRTAMPKTLLLADDSITIQKVVGI